MILNIGDYVEVKHGGSRARGFITAFSAFGNPYINVRYSNCKYSKDDYFYKEYCHKINAKAPEYFKEL